jgi:hypothetical protein
MRKVRNFHEGHSTVREWQGRGRGTAGVRQGTTWERHGMCELAFNTARERYDM